MENNLIYDYCIQNRVAIRFENNDQYEIINGLFGRDPGKNMWRNGGGYISFTQEVLSKTAKTLYRISPFAPDGHLLLTADEFFTLALPNKSILESIK